MTELKTKTNEYFAAANGFNGFESFFQEIFNPQLFEYIYILKGGPGTGKNSLMKNLHESLNGKCDAIDLIYCSSDIKSLDGIIFEYNGKKAAVIDGTAPHTTDPKYPGAVDKIINLSDAWCESTLKAHRERIAKISDLKERAYQSAYSYLKIAKSIDESVETIIRKIFTLDYAYTINELISKEEISHSNNTKKLIEAFGAGGFYRLKPNEGKRTHYTVGIYGSERVFYKLLAEQLEKKNISYERYPFVLKNDDNIGLVTTASQTLFVNLNGAPTDESDIIDTSRFLDQTELAKEKNRLEFLWREREIMLWNSVSEFKAASNYHFELEKIYTASMNFSKTDKIKEKILSGIIKSLQIKN